MESSVASERADQMTDASSEAPPLHLTGLLGGNQSESSEYAPISLSEAPSSGNDEFARWPEEVLGNAQPEPVTGGVVREDHDLSVDVKTLMIGPGPLLYGRHRRIDYVNAAFHRLAVHMHHIFNGMDRRFQFHREGAPYPRLIIGARRAAYAFDLMSVESVLTQLVHSGKIELYWVPVEEISPRKAHVVRLRERDAPRTSGVFPRNMPAHKAHKWPRTHAPFRANSTASHLHTRLNIPSCAMPFCEILYGQFILQSHVPVRYMADANRESLLRLNRSQAHEMVLALEEEELNPFDPDLLLELPGRMPRQPGWNLWEDQDGTVVVSAFDEGHAAFIRGIPSWMGCQSDIAAMVIMGFPNPHEERSDSGNIIRHEMVSLNQYATTFMYGYDVGAYAEDQFVPIDRVIDCAILHEDITALVQAFDQRMLQLGGDRHRSSHRSIWSQASGEWVDQGPIGSSGLYQEYDYRPSEWIKAPTISFGKWSREKAVGALHFAEVWLQVRRLMAETELGLLSLGSEQIGGEHVQFAWPLIVSFLGLEHPGGRLLPADAVLRLQGRSLAHPDASDQPPARPRWRDTEEGRLAVVSAISIPSRKSSSQSSSSPSSVAGSNAENGHSELSEQDCNLVSRSEVDLGSRASTPSAELEVFLQEEMPTSDDQALCDTWLDKESISASVLASVTEGIPPLMFSNFQNVHQSMQFARVPVALQPCPVFMLQADGEEQQQRFLQQQEDARAATPGGKGNFEPCANPSNAGGIKRKQAALPTDAAGAPKPRSADRHKNKSADRHKVKKDRHLHRGKGCRAHATWSLVQDALADHAAVGHAEDAELQEEQGADASMAEETAAEYEALEMEPVAAPLAADSMSFPSLPQQQEPFGPESYITPSQPIRHNPMGQPPSAPRRPTTPLNMMQILMLSSEMNPPGDPASIAGPAMALDDSVADSFVELDAPASAKEGFEGESWPVERRSEAEAAALSYQHPAQRVLSDIERRTAPEFSERVDGDGAMLPTQQPQPPPLLVDQAEDAEGGPEVDSPDVTAILMTLRSLQKMAHPQPYVLLQTTNGVMVLCLCDSGAASFCLMAEEAFLAARVADPGRFDSLSYRQKPLLVGGIEEGRKAVQIVGQVMQTLIEPESHRTVRFITAILRNASTGDAEVIFANRQFASDRWGAKIDFENMLFVISDLGDGSGKPLSIPMVWTAEVEDRKPVAQVHLLGASAHSASKHEAAEGEDMDGRRLSDSTTTEAESTIVRVADGGDSAAEMPLLKGADVHSVSHTGTQDEGAAVVSTQQVLMSEQAEDLGHKPNPSVKFSDGYVEDGALSEKFPVSPHPGKHMHLQQQFDDFLYADGVLEDVWRRKSLSELNGAELTEAVKHFADLPSREQTALMNLVAADAARAEQFLCLSCQGIAWTAREFELFEPDEHLGGSVAQGNAKLDANCRGCRNGPRGPCRADQYRVYMRSLFNQSLLYCYLEQQKDQALTNQMRLDVSEKRALVNLVREAIDKNELDLTRFSLGSASAHADSGGAGSGDSRRVSFGDLFRQELACISREVHDTHSANLARASLEALPSVAQVGSGGGPVAAAMAQSSSTLEPLEEKISDPGQHDVTNSAGQVARELFVSGIKRANAVMTGSRSSQEADLASTPSMESAPKSAAEVIDGLIEGLPPEECPDF